MSDNNIPSYSVLMPNNSPSSPPSLEELEDIDYIVTDCWALRILKDYWSAIVPIFRRLRISHESVVAVLNADVLSLGLPAQPPTPDFREWALKALLDLDYPRTQSLDLFPHESTAACNLPMLKEYWLSIMPVLRVYSISYDAMTALLTAAVLNHDMAMANTAEFREWALQALSDKGFPGAPPSPAFNEQTEKDIFALLDWFRQWIPVMRLSNLTIEDASEWIGQLPTPAELPKITPDFVVLALETLRQRGFPEK
ncbi:hypothetical protein MMC13_001146 [Lambiella insularis]|nr:hypothetical protein [Lambiella insularis]